MRPSSFRLLLVWVDGHRTWTDEDAMQEITEGEAEALEAAAAAHADGFLLLGQRNWELEVRTRRVHLPSCVRPLFTMPDGEAVDRLLGWHDRHDRWHPGLAGLQPAEARVLRLRVCERRAVRDVAWALSVRERTVVNHMTEAWKKLDALFGLEPRRRRGVPFRIGNGTTRVPARLALTPRAASGGRR